MCGQNLVYGINKEQLMFACFLQYDKALRTTRRTLKTCTFDNCQEGNSPTRNLIDTHVAVSTMDERFYRRT